MTVETHDIDAVTDRYLRRFDPFLPPAEMAWPRNSFHWANTRAGIASRRVTHGFRNAGLSVHRFARVMAAARDAVERLAETIR